MSKARDQRRAAERSERRDRIADALTEAMPGLDAEAARKLLERLGADRGIPLRELDEHLAGHPDALSSGDPRCPKAVVRLARALADAGHSEATPPACSGCGRAGIDLPRSGPGGRVCQACAAKSPENKKACAWCGTSSRIVARRDEGGICLPCYRKDPQVTVECAGCGRIRMPVTRDPGGRPLCEACWTPPEHVCAACGRTGPAKVIGPAGALCNACYQRLSRPRRPCGNCGRHLPVTRRATDDSPDLCWNCAAPPQGTCSACGRHRPCITTPDGRLYCRPCRPRAASPCSACGEVRPVTARWPRGPVCSSCYARVLDHPRECPGCGRQQPLIARDEDGSHICGPCAGLPGAYTCESCGKGGRLYAGGRCPRCVLAARLNEHLAGPDGRISRQLLPMRDALAAATAPRSILSWLMKSPNARLLGDLAANGTPLSHDVLDELPPSRYEHYVRQALVHTGVLPERHEDLDRIPAWLDQALAGRPSAHAALIRPFTSWFLLRRARRRAAHRGRPAMAGSYTRTRIRVALELLDWLGEQQLALGDLTQARLDEWLAAGNTRRYTIRYFLTWSARRGLVPQLTVPAIPRPDTNRILTEDERWDRLSRLLGDSTLPVDVRAAGSLVLLFGLHASRVRHLRTSQLIEDDGQLRLAIGSPPLLIPPKLAVLLRQLAAAPPRKPRISAADSRDDPRWLFPGLVPGRPAGQSGFNHKLREHGIDARPARGAALIALLEDVPPPILADTLGLHVNTAVRWAAIAQRDWTAYLAARDEDTSATITGERK